jgi:hypothetical protein
VGIHTLIQEENETDVVGHLLDFDHPKNSWRVQRHDGKYFSGYSGGGTGVPYFTADPSHAADWFTEIGAQHFIDISLGSMAGRRHFGGCKPVNVAHETIQPGDHVVCAACGLTHERDYCATANGHGAAR